MTIERFEIEQDADEAAEVTPLGPWVRYQDHEAALAKRLQEVRERLLDEDFITELFEAHQRNDVRARLEERLPLDAEVSAEQTYSVDTQCPPAPETSSRSSAPCSQFSKRSLGRSSSRSSSPEQSSGFCGSEQGAEGEEQVEGGGARLCPECGFADPWHATNCTELFGTTTLEARMTEPRVLDREGREITVGSRVKLDKRVPGERMIVGPAEVLTTDLSSEEPHVGVGAPGSWFTTRPAQRTVDPSTLVAPDLLLVTTNPGKDGQQHG